jgi:4-hydroxybenzoate polyprenyltransferase
MANIKNYLSLIKFSHTIFAMPFALIGFVLGIRSNYALSISISAHHLISTFILVIICMISARSAAMAFNRYLDRKFDALNPRTAIREIPKGIISPKNALTFTIISCVVFVVACFFINQAVLLLSPIALFVILFYSYTKRFTALCHLVLGIGLSLAPIGAYIAVTGQFAFLPILFSLAVVFWVSGFDIIFALQDVEFDQSQQLHSIPAALGVANALKVSSLLHLISAACVIVAGVYGSFHWLYWIGVAVFIGMLGYQHSIVKPNDLSKVNIAFTTANGIASVVFAVFVIADLIIYGIIAP